MVGGGKQGPEHAMRKHASKYSCSSNYNRDAQILDVVKPITKWKKRGRMEGGSARKTCVGEEDKKKKK